jgi:hypothetical protein
MLQKLKGLVLVAGVAAGCWSGVAAPAAKKKATEKTAESRGSGKDVLWLDPADLASRDLFYGQGGREHQPSGRSFKFVDEDKDGSNPKYNVTDAEGVKWKIKLGPEAKPETVAARFVWAVGYTAEEDYFLPELQVSGLPAHLKRGGNLVRPGGVMHNARLKRHLKGTEKDGKWSWRHDPFSGSREWNGLRVLMAVMNNWDLKDENNKSYEEKKGDGRKMYIVSDLGSSFGTTGYDPRHATAKGNLRAYKNSNFILRTKSDHVDFAAPSRPAALVIFQPFVFINRMRLRWIGRGIPRDDARWMGQLLGRLSAKQIRDAFRAGGYSVAETEGYARVVESRIAKLNEL